MNRKSVFGLFALFLVGCAHEINLPPKAIELNRYGAEALAAGDLITAEARLSLAIQYNPKFVEAWVNMGLVELKLGNLVKARHDLSRAKSLNEDLPTPHHGLGMLAETEGKLIEAEKHYKEALKVDPGFAPARVNLGRLLYARGLAEAEHAQSEEEREAAHAALDEAREQFMQLTEVAPESIEGWLGLCESLIQLDRVPEVEEQLALARRRFGDAGPILVLRARMLLNDKRYADAEELLLPATQDGDRSHASNAWAWLAITRIGKGDTVGAMAAAREARGLDPSSGIAEYAMTQAKNTAVARTAQ